MPSSQGEIPWLLEHLRNQEAVWPELPHSLTTDLNEYPKQLLRLKQCRSFRADLLHKLQLIIRSFGGWGNRGIWRTASRLGVSRFTIRRWLRWESFPGSIGLVERIDDTYTEAIERLAAAASRRKQRRPRPV